MKFETAIRLYEQAQAKTSRRKRKRGRACPLDPSREMRRRERRKSPRRRPDDD